jgi:hypothetical protein
MLTNQYVYQVFDTGDPVRMGAQVVNGIGFLGAGTIIVTRRNQIKGLTTAAGLWTSAGVGLALGIGFYEAAFIGGFAVFFGGSWTDGLVAAVIGVLIMVFTLYTPAKVNGTLKTFVTAFVAGVAALGACKFVPYTSPGEIMIGTIMLMIPGLALGTSLRDLFGGDMVSGLLRFVQALFTAAIIAAGYGLAWLTIGGVL